MGSREAEVAGLEQLEMPIAGRCRTHDWVPTGGCEQNPGVWSLGGGRFAYRDQCSRCGMVRREVDGVVTYQNQNCECGEPGVHPVPIGGGWGIACDRCRDASVASGETTVEDWAEWGNL